jgi:hypothetical protein
MNSLLMKHRPKDITEEKWRSMWENAQYLLQPLADVLMERRGDLEKIKPDDFNIANHYGKLVFEGGRVSEINYLLSLLPSSVEKHR